MSQDRYLCLDCRRAIAYQRGERIAPTASGRILVIEDRKVRVACVHCGAKRWLLLPKIMVR